MSCGEAVEQGSSLERLELWCAGQSSAEWDRGGAVLIETICDPGWRVHVDLRGTGLEHRAFDEVRDLCPGERWLHCRVRDGCFDGCGGPGMLENILARFLAWAAVAGGVAA